MCEFIKINVKDDVVVLLDDSKMGDIIKVDDKEIQILQDTPKGHKIAIKNRIMDYSTPYLDCPCFSMDKVLEALDKLPNKINKTNNYNSSYDSKMSLDELLNEYSIKNSTKKQLEEKPKSLFDKLKSIFKK